jgi:hypothetical protein
MSEEKIIQVNTKKLQLATFSAGWEIIIRAK